jgi:hypothetical protein
LVAAFVAATKPHDINLAHVPWSLVEEEKDPGILLALDEFRLVVRKYFPSL